MTATSARAQLSAKIKKMSTGMLAVAADDLAAKPSRDEAETLVLLGVTAEYRTRVARMARPYTSEQLVAQFEELEKLEYATLPRTKNVLYWVVDDELERRYPRAAAETDHWLHAHSGDDDDPGYGAMFLQKIKELNA